MPYFELEGQRIAYTEYGGGPAAVTEAGARGRTARSSRSRLAAADPAARAAALPGDAPPARAKTWPRAATA